MFARYDFATKPERRMQLKLGLILIAASAALAACGGGGGGTGPAPPLAAVPTATPIPSPTAVPTFGPSGSLLVASAATAPPITYVDYVAPGNGYGIALASPGTIYVTQSLSNAVVKLVGGTATVLTIPSPSRNPGFIVHGSDNAVWFADQSTGPPIIMARIARLDMADAFQQFDVPFPMNAEPFGMTLGPDGNVWFTEFYEGRIGRVTPQGVFSDFSLGAGVHRPSGLAFGPDGNIWVVESAGLTIERVSPSGALLDTFSLSTMLPFHITAGPDGAMWFVDAQNQIGRIDMSGNIKTWQLPCLIPNVGDFCGPGYFEGDTDIVAGPDGNLWFPTNNFNTVARLSTSGYLVEWPVPNGATGRAAPYSMTVFGNQIFFVGGGNKVGTITP